MQEMGSVEKRSEQKGTLTPLVVLVRTTELVDDLHSQLVEHLLVQRAAGRSRDVIAELRDVGHADSQRNVRRGVAHDEPCQVGGQRVGCLGSAEQAGMRRARTWPEKMYSSTG